MVVTVSVGLFVLVSPAVALSGRCSGNWQVYLEKIRVLQAGLRACMVMHGIIE